MVIIDINKLTRIFTKTASELSYRAEQIQYAHKLPQLSSSDRQIVTQLKQERIAITSLTALSITDEEMNKVVPASKWKSCPGSAGTVIFADNAKIFHHGKIPQRDRYTLFYAYTSRKPKRPDLCRVSPWREGLPLLAGKLSTRQQASIWNW